MSEIFNRVCKSVKQGGWIWNALGWIYIIKSDKYHNKIKLLKKNRQFKNIHKGERCFVLGNGPSLNNVDFSLLSNEQVFTVNCLMENPEFELLKTNYHFWMDYNGFGLREDVKTDVELSIKMMRKLENKKNLVYFVPAEAFPVIKKYKLDKKIKIRYLDMIDFNKINKIDISKASLGFTTVVQHAIETAIYMGFKEIYLLGCDTTILKAEMEVMLGEEMSKMHAYEEDEGETQKDAFKQLLKNGGIRPAIKDTLQVLDNYEKLNTYCESKGIKLVNLSDVTLIDCIRRDKLSNVLL